MVPLGLTVLYLLETDVLEGGVVFLAGSGAHKAGVVLGSCFSTRDMDGVKSGTAFYYGTRHSKYAIMSHNAIVICCLSTES